MIAVLAGAGLIVGGALPWLIARIPDRTPDHVSDGAHDHPEVTPYRELAGVRGLPVILGIATAGVWALLAPARAELGLALAAYLVVAALGVAMAYIDIREHRLPDWLTFPAFGAAAVALGIAAAVEGDWPAYGRAWAAAAAATAFYLTLVLLRPADLGLGDVKLAAVLGLLLGWIGWQVLVVGVFAGFVVGAVVGIVLMALRRAGRRTAIPFGPPMLAGALIATVWGEVLVDAYVGL